MAKTKQQIRVLLADDHAIFRDGLRKLLDSDEDITIVGEAQNGAECIKLLAKLKPDILLLDLRMPDKDGLAVLEEVNFDTLPTRVVGLTAAEDDRDEVRAMRLGARAPPRSRFVGDTSRAHRSVVAHPACPDPVGGSCRDAITTA